MSVTVLLPSAPPEPCQASLVPGTTVTPDSMSLLLGGVLHLGLSPQSF